jgi:hypothetical protein
MEKTRWLDEGRRRPETVTAVTRSRPQPALELVQKAPISAVGNNLLGG